MSELENLLEDIKEGKDIVNDEAGSEKEVTTEEFLVDAEEEESEDINVVEISEESLALFQGLHQRTVIAESLANEPKVDKSIVLEAMATLPRGVSRLEEAKLTSSASVINKDILNSVVGRDSEEVLSNFKETVSKLNDSLLSYMSGIKVPLEELDNWASSLKDIDASNKEHLIIYNSETINLITQDLNSISMIDWSLVEYEKYSSQTLGKLFDELADSFGRTEYLTKLLTVGDVYEPSLIDVINALRGPIRSQLASCVTRITGFHHSANSYLQGNKLFYPEVMSYLESINSDIVLYNTIRKIVSSPESPLGAISELLSVIV